MTRQLLAGAWYGDHLPNGEFCALFPGVHCLTHLGPVPFPPGEAFGPLFVRCTKVNGFRFAGQAHDTLDPACWEWDTAVGGWVPYAPPCVGVSPVIYDRDGVLHRSDGSVGSQGYRFVRPDNTIATGDETYGPFHGLFEYTFLGDGLWIGQAAYDGGGVQVLKLSESATATDWWQLLQLELGDCRFIRANRDGDTVALAFTRPEGVVLMRTTMAELRALPPVVPPQPPDPPQPPPFIGPLSDALPDGAVVEDLLPYVVGNPETWPRRGPSHTLGQVLRPGNHWEYVKFAGNEPGAAQGQSYEGWWWSECWIGQKEDASGGDPYQQTDQRMWPRRMPVGERFAFKTGEHEIVWRKRPDPIDVPAARLSQTTRPVGTNHETFAPCQETQRQPWQRRMWVQAVWPRFDCGPDLGVRAVAMLVYDATAGFFIPGRYIEVGYYALGAGSFRWEAHASWLMNAPPATFTDATRVERKDFYLIGGPNPAPQLLTCFSDTIPNYPPWDPQPKPPQPYPSVTGVSMTTEQGWLIGPGDKALAMNAQGTVTFERYQLTDTDLLEASALAGDSKGRASVRSVTQGLYLGADATQYSPVGVCGQYYGVPTVGGNYEKWTFGQWASGIVEAAVDYIDQGADHGRHWKAAGLTWIKK